MRRPILALVIAAAAIAVSAPGATAGGPLTLKRTLTFVGPPKDTRHGIVSRIVLTTDRGTVGTATLTCTKRDGEPFCSFRSRFSEGKISARGPLNGRLYPHLPIVGGSGAFEDAHGELRVERHSPPGTDGTAVYDLRRFG